MPAFVRSLLEALLGDLQPDPSQVTANFHHPRKAPTSFQCWNHGGGGCSTKEEMENMYLACFKQHECRKEYLNASDSDGYCEFVKRFRQTFGYCPYQAYDGDTKDYWTQEGLGEALQLGYDKVECDGIACDGKPMQIWRDKPCHINWDQKTNCGIATDYKGDRGSMQCMPKKMDGVWENACRSRDAKGLSKLSVSTKEYEALAENMNTYEGQQSTDWLTGDGQNVTLSALKKATDAEKAAQKSSGKSLRGRFSEWRKTNNIHLQTEKDEPAEQLTPAELWKKCEKDWFCNRGLGKFKGKEGPISGPKAGEWWVDIGKEKLKKSPDALEQFKQKLKQVEGKYVWNDKTGCIDDRGRFHKYRETGAANAEDTRNQNLGDDPCSDFR